MPTGRVAAWPAARSISRWGRRSPAPRVLAARGELARWWAESGDHPDTLLTRNNLLHYRSRTGDTEGVLAAFEELLADRAPIIPTPCGTGRPSTAGGPQGLPVPTSA